jgi:adenosylcobinamide-phosphate synthase
MWGTITLLALLIEAAVGYPDRLFRAIGHPVTWIGRLIGTLDRTLNHESASNASRRRAGAAALLIVVASTAAAALVVERTLLLLPLSMLATAIIAGTLIAQRSLYLHVARVAAALEQGGVAAGREAVAHIVGRDPEALDEAGVARAAIESLAENFSDGVVAPLFWMAVAGLPGGLAYKAVNTADSMIGHKSDRHRDFGWASARLDDLVNWPASRLSALLLVAAAFLLPGASPAKAWKAVRRDATKHRSPNAGWPEAAMAGALGLSIAGPRYYHGVLAVDAEMGAGGRRQANAADIRRALALYRTADTLLVLLVGAVAAFVTLQAP